MTVRLTPRDVEKRLISLARDADDARDGKDVVDALRSLPPAERGECLRLFDGRGTGTQIDRFVADTIGDPAMRREALRLIGEARPFMHSPGRVVVSDIDDTVKPHSDKTHRGPVYPGAQALFSALDVGRDGTDSRGDIHFVTARDGVVVRAGNTLNDTGIDVGSISYGTTWAMMLAGIGLHGGIAREKVKDILNLAARNPDRKLVLLGDTVQADAKVFDEVLKKIPDRVELVLLHAVPGFAPPVDLSGHENVVVFSDYADAANQLAARGTISTAQRDAVLADVAAAASRG